MTAEITVTGKPCADCHAVIQPGDNVAVCAACGTVHHAACWTMLGRCSVAECPGTPVQQVAPKPTMFVPPTAGLPPTPPPPLSTVSGYAMNQEMNVPPGTGSGTLLSTAWALMQQDMGNAILAFLIVNLISGAIGSVPYIGGLISGFVVPPIQGGLSVYALNYVNRRNPQLGDLFNGFQQYGRWLGIYWLLAAIGLACAIPGGILLAIGLVSLGVFVPQAAPDFTPMAVGLLAAGVLVMLIICMAVLPRFTFAYFLGAEGYEALDALRVSHEMAQGRVWQIIGIGIALGLVNLLGVIACFVGLLFTIPLTFFAMALYYNAVKQARGMA